MRHRLAIAVLAALSARAFAAPPAEPYVWKSVVIEANGFINGVVFGQAANSPTYMNTDMGGAYRLDGDTWQPLTDWVAHDDWSLNQNGVETLAVDPTDPNKVYFGLGTYMGPSAVIRSTDGGRTYQRTNVEFAMNGNGLGRNSGQRMNVDPNLPTHLLYGTRAKGLYESRDSAVTWSRVTGFPATGDTMRPLKDVGLVWTLFDAASGKPGAATPVAYVGVCTNGADKIFRTTDAGKTWAPIPGQPGGRLLPTRAVLTPDGKTLYATFVTAKEAPGPFGVSGGAVYKCQDPAGGKPTWTDISPKAGGAGVVGGFSGVSLDPQSPTTVYVTTLDHYANGGDDIFRSKDGGATWTGLNISKHRDDGDIAYIKDGGIHWTGDVEVNPHDGNEAYFTTGYGLYRTTDLRSDAPTWHFFNHGFEQSAALELISPKSGSANLISAIGDRDGYRHENLDQSPKYGRLGQVSTFGQTKNLSMGTCNDIDVAWDQPTVAVRVGAGAQWSNDGGVTWQTFPGEGARNGFAEMDRGARGPRGGSVAVTADGKAAVWAAERHGALVSVRNGDGWSAWIETKGLPAGNVMLAADPANPAAVYASGKDGFYASTDAGHTFAKTPAAVNDPGWLRATPGHAGHLWLTSGEEGTGGLWHSTDGGQSWAHVAGQTLTCAKQVGIGAPPPGKDYPAVFIGGTVDGVRGFFRSDDQGQTWVRVNDDAHQYGNVTVINGDSRVFGRLYVGTNGRGILYGDRAAAAAR